MDKLLSNKKSIAVFVLPSFLIFFAIAIIPLFITGYYSLFSYDGVSKMDFIGLKNYLDMFAKDKIYINSNKNAFILMMASLFIQLPLSFLFALILSKGVLFEKFFRTVYFIPVVISSIVIGRLWISIWNSDAGLLNILISNITGKKFDFSWLTDSKTAFISTVIPAVWQFIGYHMLILYAGIKSISTEYYEAATIDGATSFQATKHITIPLLVPVIKTCVIFAIFGSVKAFDLVYIMTGGGPNNISQVPSTLMYQNLFKRSLYGYGSAQAFVIVLECILISLIVTKLFKKSEDNLFE